MRYDSHTVKFPGALPAAPAVSLDYRDDAVRTVTVKLTGAVITMADEAGVVAYGGLKILDLPDTVWINRPAQDPTQETETTAA